MDIFFMSFLFSVLIVFMVFSWLPNFGSVNGMVFAVIAMGTAFMLTFVIFDSSLTVLQPYPANSTIINVGGNLTITNANATFTTHIYEDSWQLAYFFLMLGLISFTRLVFFIFDLWKGTTGPNARLQ